MSEWLTVINGTVLSDKDISSSAKVVYGAISSFTANGTKAAFPSRAAIAERAGLQERNISRLVSELVSAGYISVNRRGKRLSNTYEVMAQKCAITKKCHHNSEQSDGAKLGHLSIKTNTEKNSIPIPQQAEDIYAHYASVVRRGGASDAIQSITTLLKIHRNDELIGAIDFYAATDHGQGEARFRYQANNFFGKKEYYKEFLMEGSRASSPSPPRELTEIESAIQQKLIEAGLA